MAQDFLRIDGTEVPVEPGGIREIEDPISEFEDYAPASGDFTHSRKGTVRGWQVTTAILDKDEYETIMNVLLSCPPFLQVFGLAVSPQTGIGEVCDVEIENERVLRQGQGFVISFVLWDATGLEVVPMEYEDAYEVWVYVYRRETGEPMEGVLVDLDGYQGTTDFLGRTRILLPEEDRVFPATLSHEEYPELKTEHAGLYIDQDYSLEDPAELWFGPFPDTEKMEMSLSLSDIEWQDMLYNVNFTVKLLDGTELSDVTVTIHGQQDQETEVITAPGTANLRPYVEPYAITIEHGTYGIEESWKLRVYDQEDYELDAVMYFLQGDNSREEETELSLELDGIVWKDMRRECIFTIKNQEDEVVEDAEVTVIGQQNQETVQETTDEHGIVTFNLRPYATPYNIHLNHESYDAEDYVWIVVEDDPETPLEKDLYFLELDGRNELLENQIISLTLPGIEWEHPFLTDFSEEGAEDKWMERWNTDDQDWEIEELAGASGDKVMQHTSTANVRRFLSFVKMTSYAIDHNDLSFLTDVEAITLCRTGEKHYNQNRIHVRSGRYFEDRIEKEDGINSITLMNDGIRFQKPCDFEFHTKDGDGNDLEMVNVTIQRKFDDVTETSDSDGIAYFEDIAFGDVQYDWTAERAGYVTQSGTLTPGIDDEYIFEEVTMPEA